MAIVKLAVGTPLIMNVEDVEDVEGQFGPQRKFTGADGNILFLGTDTVERQAERLGGVTAWAGSTWSFEKVQKGSKTFINIEHVGKQNGTPGRVHSSSTAAATGHTTPEAVTAPSPAPQPDSPQPEKQSALYLRMTKWTIEEIVPLYVKAGIPITMEGTAAIVATNFIAKNGRH